MPQQVLLDTNKGVTMNYSRVFTLFISTCTIMAHALKGGDPLQLSINPITHIVSTTASVSSKGANNGRITIEAIVGGTAPYSVSVVAEGQSTHTKTFNGIALTFDRLAPALYTIFVSDSNKCTLTSEVQVCHCIDVTFTPTPACFDGTHGAITVIDVSGGDASSQPYTVEIQGVTQVFNPQDPLQQPLVFSHLRAGANPIRVRDQSGCSTTISAFIETSTALGVLATTTPADHNGTGGTIEIQNIVGGVPPYKVVIGTNGNDPEFKPFTPGTPVIFSNLAAGIYIIVAFDANRCSSYPLGIVVGSTSSLSSIS